MIKTITCHQKTASIDEMFGKEYISTSNLLRLSNISTSSFYKKFNEKRFYIAKYLYLNGRGRYNAITLEGAIEFLNMFREPDDALIKTIESYIERQKTEKIETEPDCFSTERKEVIDEVESLSSELDIHGLNKRIENIDNRLLDVENNLSYLNDKPKESNNSLFRQLLKECIKEIILEELHK